MTRILGHSIVGASRDRFLAMNGGQSAGIVARAVAAVDLHTPLIGVKGGSRVGRYHEVDVVVLGQNSLLGLLAARSLTRLGQVVMFAGLPGLAGMPKGLIDDPVFREALTDACGLTDRFQGRPGCSWLDRLASFLVASADLNKLLVPSSYMRFELGRRRAGDELVLFGSNQETDFGREGADFIAAAHGEVRRWGKTAILSTDGLRRPVVLARRVVLTSFLEGFAQPETSSDEGGLVIGWTAPQLIGIGTGRRDDRRVRDALSAMLDDTVRAARGEL